MSYNIEKIEAKHGVFKFILNDQFIGNAINEYGEFSEIELSIMNKFIEKNDIVFDIGSNIGAFTIPFAKKVGENGEVFAFEPQPFIFNLLKHNVKLNKLKNVNLFKNGVGERKKNIKIDEMDYSSEGNFGGFTLTSKYSNSNCGIVKKKKINTVKIIKLDDFLHLEKCNFVKIDVELMEIDVLKGGKKFLKKYKPILWIENHQEYPNKINKFLQEIGYSSYWACTSMYNPNNYFINDKNIYNYFINDKNIHKNLSTLNTLAIPQGQTIDDKYFGLTKVNNPNTKPSKLVIEPLR